jgi:hypothetical protein
MSEWSASGRVNIERAKEHVHNLKAAIDLFFQQRPYCAVTEKDEKTGDTILRLRVSQPPPARFGAIAGDAIHNLRSSLDSLWRCVMHPNGGGKSDRRGGFVIHETAKGFEATSSRQVRGRRKDAMEVLKAIKPYQGGNDLLWLLHVADIDGKHHRLIPAYSSLDFVNVDLIGDLRRHFQDLSAIPQRRKIFKMRNPVCPLEDGALLWRGPTAESDMHMDTQFGVEIAFGESQMLKGKPMIPTLNKFVDMVDGIVKSFIIAGLLIDH